jgi:hypothetical protein
MLKVMTAQEKQEKAQQAKTFDTFSAQNYSILKAKLACTCEPYQDIFTFNRWSLQGYKINKGEHALKIMTYVKYDIRDKNDNIVKTISKPKTTNVFCRCQVTQQKQIAV